MNIVTFSTRGIKKYDNDVPVMRIIISDEKDPSNVIDESVIYWEKDHFACYNSHQTRLGNSPFINPMLVLDSRNLRGQLALCVMDHLFIMDDLLHYEIKSPNLSGRLYNKIIEEFLNDTMKYIKKSL